MKKERRKIVITGVIIILVIASLIIGLVGNKLYVNNKIRDSNINTYQFLKCITSCDTIYNIDLTSKSSTSRLDDDCQNSCLEFLKKVSLKPGEVSDDRLILESEGYSECTIQKNTKGVDEYKACLEKLIPEIEKSYPVVLGK